MVWIASRIIKSYYVSLFEKIGSICPSFLTPGLCALRIRRPPWRVMPPHIKAKSIRRWIGGKGFPPYVGRHDVIS